MSLINVWLLGAVHIIFKADVPGMSRCPSIIAGPPLQAVIMKMSCLFNTDASGTVPGVKNMCSALRRHTI